MTNTPYSTSQFSLLLPKLKPECDVGAGKTAGEWTNHNSRAFQDVAASLDYKAPGELKSISSVPTMWARPLTMEMALHNPNHPIRAQMIVQWQGMLAAIALSEMRGFPLKAELIELGKFQGDAFGRSLWELLPDPINSLYKETGKNPWQDLYVFLWKGKPVGMTTPSTLVVASEEGDWTDLPWWQGSLQVPQSHLNDNEKALLWHWLENLRNELNQHNGNRTPINTMGGLIAEFQASLLPIQPNQGVSLSEELQFFGTRINRGVLKALNHPTKALVHSSSIKIVASQGKQPSQDLLLLDPRIPDQWNKPPQNVWIHQGKTFASLDLTVLRANPQLLREVKWIEPDSLFLPELTFINYLADALPGALMPDQTHPLMFASEQITPLLPLNPILLDYLTAEELRRRVKFHPLTDRSEPQVEVTLVLPLAGVGEVPMEYSLSKVYTLKEENALDGVPVLEVWPNFRAADWHEYYGFYFDAALGKDTFQVEFPNGSETSRFKDQNGGSYQMVRMREFPALVLCRNLEGQDRGLILLKQPEEISANGQWTVGVDFGTSFTNIYINRDRLVEKLPLESLLLEVARSPVETRFPTLIAYFIPTTFLPSEKPLPLSSVLTTLGSNANRSDRPIFDGRIYIPSPRKFDPKTGSIQTDLKWSNIDANRLFLKHLILHISALALKSGIKQIRWLLSFPSAFSKPERIAYVTAWKDLTRELMPRTGLNYECPDGLDSPDFRTESLAVAQYFADADEERADMIYSTCIDMGGGTSDISIWEDNRLVHQCSVQLAGRDLLSKFLEQNPQFLEKRFGVNISEWRGLRDGAFHAKLDVLLRWESEEWLSRKLPTLLQAEDVQGLLRLTAIGIAGLYYYVGILLKVLHENGNYQRGTITPVYLGGNGSRLLNWLDGTGRFTRDSEINDLLSQMLSRGAGFDNTGEKTRLSKNPKDEVACGLVLDYTKLQGLDHKTEDLIIAGEDCEIIGEHSRIPIAWNQRLSFEDLGKDENVIKEFRISNNFGQLSHFLYDFHIALRELNISSIQPLKNYKRSLTLSDNDRLWRETQRKLDKIKQDSRLTGEINSIRIEPPFILCLKALLSQLSNEWAGR